jgi:O-antigen ligase
MGTRGLTSLLWFFHQVRPRGIEALGYGFTFGPLAQSVEQRTFNPWVVGSIPTGPTLVLVILAVVSNLLIEAKARQWITFGCAAITIVVSPWRNFDSINLIKLCLLSAIALSIVAMFLISRNQSVWRHDKAVFACGIFFLSALTLPLFASNAPITQQFWGMFGRGNGWLAYASALVFFIVATQFSRLREFENLVKSIVMTAGILTVYALVQFFGYDPIPWSQKMVIATLGNINFLSAFFGLSSLAATSLFLSNNKKTIHRLALLALVIVDLLLVLSTKSIQGVMLFLGGLVLVIYLRLREFSWFVKTRLIYFGAVTSLFVVTVLGLTNRGPFASFVFAPSVLYRADYWHAGWKMTIAHPWFGVGLDSYGDYYREYRGLISTIRTIPERTANTAHNIFLDLSSGGGLPLLISYLALLFLATRACIRVIKRTKKFDPISAAITSVLLGYQIQALVSIAQIGVSIWGWTFMGAAIAFEKFSQSTDQSGASKLDKKKAERNGKVSKQQLLMPSAAMASFAGFCLGFAIAFPPLSVDAAFRKAYESSDIPSMSQAVQKLGSSAFLVGMALEFAAKNGNQVVGDPLNDLLNSKYPRDMYGWRVKYAKPWATPTEKALAVQKMKALDPYNPEIPQS